MTIRLLLTLSLCAVVSGAGKVNNDNENQERGPVKIFVEEPGKVLVGRSFEEIATRTGQAIFVGFCPTSEYGYCDRLGPAWNQLAEKNFQSDRVIIAETKASMYHDDTILPILKLFPVEGKTIEYSGDRELSDLEAFLNEQLGETTERSKITQVDTKDEKRPAVIILIEESDKALLGRSFEEIAKRTGKALFVMFFASWSGHCKALAPTWNELAQKYFNSDQVLIARVDATAYPYNTVGGEEIRNFPTLKFYPLDGEAVDYYNGHYRERTLPNLEAFVNEQLGKEKRNEL